MNRKTKKNISIKIYSKGEREKKDYKLGTLHYIASPLNLLREKEKGGKEGMKLCSRFSRFCSK